MKILLTGGAGFIGSSLVKELSKNHIVKVFDNLERNALKDLKLQYNPVIVGDVTDFNSVDSTIKKMKPDIIIHLAAIAGVDNVLKRPIQTMEVNILGTQNLLKSVIKNKIKLKKIISFSTSEVYGNYSYKLGENETTVMGAVGEARWSYSISKLAAEHLLFSYYKEHNVPVVSIRPFNIYGPNQVGEGAIQIFLNKCLKNQDIEIHGDGSQIRSWCYIDDAIDFILRCIDKEESIGNVFNMGNPEGTITTLGLAKKIIKITNSQSKIKFIEIPYVDVELRIPNIEKGRLLLGFEPKVDLEDGIRKTYDSLKQKNRI